MSKKLRILNINIDSISLSDLLNNLKEGFLVTPNVDHLIKLQKNYDFYKSYQKANYVICDSQIVKIALKFLGSPVKQVIPGSSFLPAFYNFHSKNEDIKIFLLGASEGVAIKAMQNINKKIGRNIIVGVHSPTFGFENNIVECETIVNIINNCSANVLVLGVGAPKQEIWINKYNSKLTKIKIFMALGATIDFEAGNIKRAPKIFQKIGLEWLYRLVKEPKRLWKRYLVDDVPFFFYILKQKLGLYKNPFE